MPFEIAYAPADPSDSRGHLLDLYLPELPVAERVPLVIWSSGSAFYSDDGKAGAVDAAAYFNPIGWAVAGVSVRSSSQVRFPGQVHDIKAAVRWLRAHADEYGLDAGRFATMGDSSGGWMAMMAGLTAANAELEGDLGVTGVSCAVQAVIDLYGPTDFLQMDAHMVPGALDEFNAMVNTTDGHADARSPESCLLGAPIHTVPELAAAANPVAYVSAAAPPTLIVHGGADQLVPHHQSELLYGALAAAGTDATFVSIPGNRHEKPYLADSRASVGRVVTSTRAAGADLSLLHDEGPTWAAVAAFLRHALAVA